MPPVEIATADPAGEPGSALLAAMVAEVAGIYGPADGDDRGFAIGRDDLAPPGGAFLVIRDAGEAVACGGVKRWDAATGEIKRMYVVPGARSRGLGRVLLGALEDAARGLGYSAVRLDTGARQPHALALYRATGYREIADYNGNRRAAYWFEKAL